MNEESARAVTLLQAFETAQPPSPHWGDADRAWATRVAQEEGPADAPAEFVARRARHAMLRLSPRLPAVGHWLRRRLWNNAWVAWAMLGGLLVGLLADGIGSSQRVNLLAPPMWAVLAWNAVVYVLLLGHALALAVRRPTRSGGVVRITQRLLRMGRGLPRSRGDLATDPATRPLQAFALLWWGRSGALSAARAAALLHAAAAALAVGMIGGLYLRGLVLDYRAAWESTFLSVGAAHAVVVTVLAPASAIAGIALPDLASFGAMRVAHDGAVATAPAAPWIHLYALTLALFVVVPRVALALTGAARAHWLARHWPLPLSDPYFHRLARLQKGDVAHVLVQPYAVEPGPQASAVLQRLLAPALGDGMQLAMTPGATYGAEDESPGPLPPATTLAIAYFDASATPERETHGRYAQQLLARAPTGASTLVLVDETRFKQRFAADARRLAQRRDAWRLFAEWLDTLPVFVDMSASDLADAERAVQLALRSPVRAPAA